MGRTLGHLWHSLPTRRGSAPPRRGAWGGGGRVIARACAREFKRWSLEMGGKNIIIVMDDANLDLAIEGAVWGGFGTSGQRCTAASRVAVHKKVYREFLDRFAQRGGALKIGDGLDAGTQIGPLVNETQLQTVMKYVEIGKEENAKLIVGGHRADSGKLAAGWFHEPTIFAGVDPAMRIAQEEIFGPVVALLAFDNFDEAIEVANGIKYGLSASIYTRDVNKAY